MEDIAFSVDDLARVAWCASEAGLPIRCHADQLGPSGAAEAAVALGARSADHLNHVSAAGVTALGAAHGTVGVLLPTSTLFLRSAPPDARALLDAGAVIAIASDFNPGTSPVVSMPEVIATASSLYGLRPLEALTAATANAAAVRWTVHGERYVYDSDWMSMALVDVEVPDGPRFEHHVVRFDAGR